MSLLLPHRQLLLPRRPFFLGSTTQTNTTTPITLTLPRRGAGVFLLAFIARHAGGTATPALPTGWTNITTSTVDPECRVCYRFCNGSEAATTTSAAASATSMSAIVVAFSGCHSTWSPTGSTIATGTSTAPNPASLTSASSGKMIAYVAWAMWNGSGTVTEYPSGYVTGQTTVVQGTNGGQALAIKNGNLVTEDPPAFAISASLLWGAQSTHVRAI